MVRRHQGLGFAGGSYVFPGGCVDAQDMDLASNPHLCLPVPGLTPEALAFRVAAIRETFEEAGILLARGRGSGAVVGGEVVDALAAGRGPAAHGAMRFAELLSRGGLTLATDLLVPFARWVTPSIFATRFDTMFFLAVGPDDQAAHHDGQETVDSRWVRPVEALSNSSGMRLEFVTRRNLEKLGRDTRAGQALEGARRQSVVTVQPEIDEIPGGRRARLPLEAGYGGPVFDFSK